MQLCCIKQGVHNRFVHEMEIAFASMFSTAACLHWEKWERWNSYIGEYRTKIDIFPDIYRYIYILKDMALRNQIFNYDWTRCAHRHNHYLSHPWFSFSYAFFCNHRPIFHLHSSATHISFDTLTYSCLVHQTCCCKSPFEVTACPCTHSWWRLWWTGAE